MPSDSPWEKNESFPAGYHNCKLLLWFFILFCFVFLEKERESMEKGEAELGGVGRGERIWSKYSVGLKKS